VQEGTNENAGTVEIKSETESQSESLEGTNEKPGEGDTAEIRAEDDRERAVC
jgi:hypothetical protein